MNEIPKVIVEKFKNIDVDFIVRPKKRTYSYVSWIILSFGLLIFLIGSFLFFKIYTTPSLISTEGNQDLTKVILYSFTGFLMFIGFALILYSIHLFKRKGNWFIFTPEKIYEFIDSKYFKPFFKDFSYSKLNSLSSVKIKNNLLYFDLYYHEKNFRNDSENSYGISICGIENNPEYINKIRRRMSENQKDITEVNNEQKANI